MSSSRQQNLTNTVKHDKNTEQPYQSEGRSQAASTLEDVQDLVSPNAALLRLLGLWSAPGSAGEGTRGVAALARGWFCWVMVLFIAATSAGKLCLDTPEELTALADYGYTVFHLSAVTVKVACFILQRSTIQELVKQLAYSRKTYGRRQADNLVREFYQRRATTVYRILQVLVLLVICLWISAPLLQYKTADEFPDSEEVDRQPPNPVWIPPRSPEYEIVYSVQALCGTMAVQLSMLIDASFYKLMMLVTAELQILNDNLAVLGRADASAERKGSCPTNVLGQETDDVAIQQINQIKQTAAPVTEHNDHPRKLLYLRHHQVVVKCFNLLQLAITYSISILLLSNILTVCFSIFVVSVSDGGLKRAMKTIAGIPSVLGETGMYCIFGQMVVNQILNSSYTLINLLYQFQGPKD